MDAEAKKKIDYALEESLVMFGFTPTFTPESLSEMEGFIVNLYPNGMELPTTQIPFGWYLGETIVRNIPDAVWVLNENLFEWKIEVPVIMDVQGKKQTVTAAAMPFVRIDKFMNDKTDGLRVFFDGLNAANLGMMPKMDKAPDGKWGKWKNMPNGNAFRMKTVNSKKEK